MSRFIIEFYEDRNGNKPIEEFLLGLDIKMRAKLVGLFCYENHTANTWKMESLKFVANQVIISQEYYIFSIMMVRLF